MTPNGVIEVKNLEMTNNSILIKFTGLFEITGLKNIYKCMATRWTPKLEMNTNTKISKRPTDDRTDGWTDILYCH